MQRCLMRVLFLIIAACPLLSLAATIPNYAPYSVLVFSRTDDGGIVYLNTNEVFRSNMTNTVVDFNTPALQVVGGADESTFFPTNVNPALFREGTNLLAVEIHQQSTTSSDVSFDLYLTARLFGRPDLTISREADRLRLGWPTVPPGFTAEKSDSLDRTWTPVTEIPTEIQGMKTVVLDFTPEIRFYRLKRN